MELELRGVMTTERPSRSAGSRDNPGRGPVLPALVLLDAEDVEPLIEIALLGQSPMRAASSYDGGTPRPSRVRPVGDWNTLLDGSTDGLIWLTDGRDSVTDRFLSPAAQRLAEVPEAASHGG